MMSDDLIRKLIDRGAESYPVYYDGTIPSAERTIGVGAGWYPLIAHLHARLVVLSPHYRILTIKQKFGGLRFVVDPETIDRKHSVKIRELITKAEDQSLEICEQTGGPGVLMKCRRGGFVSTLDPKKFGPPDWYRVQPVADMQYKVKK